MGFSNPIIPLKTTRIPPKKTPLELEDGDDSKFRFVVIGPPSSGQLKEMVGESSRAISQEESSRPISQERLQKKPRIEIFSTRATKDEKQILGDLEPPISFHLEPNNVHFLRTTPDFELAHALVKELKLRGVTGSSPIALFSEWDTDYGRAFQKTICKAWRRVFPEIENTCADLDNIYYFSYLRGLDGQLPEPEGQGES